MNAMHLSWVTPLTLGLNFCDCSPAWPRLTPPRRPTASPSNLFPEEEHGPLILPKASEPLRLPRPFHLAPSQVLGTHLLPPGLRHCPGLCSGLIITLLEQCHSPQLVSCLLSKLQLSESARSSFPKHKSDHAVPSLKTLEGSL